MNSILLWAARSAATLTLLAPAHLLAQAPVPSSTVQAPVAQAPAAQAPATQTTPAGSTTQPAGQVPPAPLPQVPGVQQPLRPQEPAPIPVAPPDPKVRLEVPITDHDFGSMIEGEIARHTFDMTSAGENPLIIVSAKPSCGCTISQAKVEGEGGQFVEYHYGQPIAPGKKVKIEAELNTKNKHNLAQSKINIQCNDPRQIVTLGLSAMVDTYFLSTPASLDFGELSTTDMRELTATVSSKRGGKFKLRQDAVGVIPGMKVELKPVAADEQGAAERWEVKVTMGPDCREGNMGYPVQLRSDQLVQGAQIGADGQAPSYGASVMVQAKVRGLITYEPQYLSFGLVRPGQSLTRTLKLSCYDPKFQLTQPVSMKLVGQSDAVPEFRWADKFEVLAKPSADGRTMDIDVTLKGMPEGSDSAFQGRVMIETGHPSRPKIYVLFSGVCRSAAPVAPVVPVPAPVPAPAPVKGNQ